MHVGCSRPVLRPKSPVRSTAANSRVKPTVNCEFLPMLGSKGWLADASQISWSGVADMCEVTMGV